MEPSLAPNLYTFTPRVNRNPNDLVGASSAAIFYGSGYIPGRDFWKLGFILGVIFFGVYIAIGVPWLAYLEI